MREAILKQISKLKLVYNVDDIAPNSFEELMRNTGTIKVWSGASDNTIFHDPAINHAFRAWHDYCHKLLNADFSLQGELLVAQYQANILGVNKLHGDLIMIEVYQQAKHFYDTGVFPIDQVAFTTKLLKQVA